MGTPEFAVPSLAAIIRAGYDVCAVYSQPPRPSGRGYKIQLSPVHAFALTQNIPVHTPVNFKNIADQEQFKSLNADVAVVVAYGLILNQHILDAPQFGCINIHGSLLPRWRGAAPIQRAILAGDHETGITIMYMDKGLDTGNMLLKDSIKIDDQITASIAHDQLSHMGAQLIVQTLDTLQRNGKLESEIQPTEGVTYASKLKREEGLIDWHNSAAIIHRQVRALNPWPGTYFMLRNEIIKVLKAEIITDTISKSAGMVLDDQLTIACKDYAIRPLILQRAGKKALSIQEFLRGNPIVAGTNLYNIFDSN